ncbi:MAG: hypothetical protein U1E65_00035 [Myxococcota bacterium]
MSWPMALQMPQFRQAGSTPEAAPLARHVQVDLAKAGRLTAERLDETGGPAGYTAPSQSAAALAVQATLGSAERSLNIVDDALSSLEAKRGQALDPELAGALQSLLARLDSAADSLFDRRLAQDASAAGKGDQVNALRSGIGERYGAIRSLVEAAPTGDIAKARQILKTVVAAERRISPETVLPNVGAFLSVPLSARALPLAEQAEAFYERGASAHTLFGKVAHFGIAEDAIRRLLDHADADGDARAWAGNLGGMIKHAYGDDGAALKAYGLAMAELGRPDAALSYNLGVAHASLGHAEKAVTALSAALQVSTSEVQRAGIAALAASDPALWSLMSEPGYHALLKPFGGTQLTRMPEQPEATRPWFATPGWHYEVPAVAEREDMQVFLQNLNESKYGNHQPPLHVEETPGGGLSIWVETEPKPEHVKLVELATLELKKSAWHCDILPAVGVLTDPAGLHALLAELKLRDHRA